MGDQRAIRETSNMLSILDLFYNVLFLDFVHIIKLCFCFSPTYLQINKVYCKEDGTILTRCECTHCVGLLAIVPPHGCEAILVEILQSKRSAGGPHFTCRFLKSE